jgi:uncharacterized protein YbbC (DUF1343 family)
MPIETGLQVLLREQPHAIKDKTVGLLTNYACITAGFDYSIDLILEAGAKRVIVFAPEHGFWSDVQYMDPLRREQWRSDRVAIRTSYDDKNPSLFTPDPSDIADLDLLLVEVQDAGARCYTYVATMIKSMGIASELGVPVFVLDRPNPIDGLTIEGNVVYHEPYISYVMHSPVPMRHAMTAGELARLANDVLGLQCELEVIPMRGWRRSMLWRDTELPWVSPSPNIATPETAIVYPATVFLEATNLSEGRGTTHPFELIGAPWLDSFELADRLNALNLGGVHFRPQPFTPMFSKFSGQSASHEEAKRAEREQCGGVFIHVTEAAKFEPVKAGLLLLKVARDLAPEKFAWRRSNYEFAHCMAIDALTGTSRYQVLVDRGDLGGVQEWIATWKSDEERFASDRKQYLIADYLDDHGDRARREDRAADVVSINSSELRA